MSVMQPTDEQQFARNLAQRRDELGMSQSELARRMVEAGWESYSQMTVSRTEKGERPIRLGEARALARVLRSNLNDMISETPGEATVRQAEEVADALDRSIVAIAHAIASWRTASDAANAFLEDVAHEMQSLDVDTQVRLDGALDRIRVMNFDLSTLIEWASTRELLILAESEGLPAVEFLMLRDIALRRARAGAGEDAAATHTDLSSRRI